MLLPSVRGQMATLGRRHGIAVLGAVRVRGVVGWAVARGYHLYSLPGNRGRTAASWLTEAAFGRQGVQLGLVRGKDVPLDTDTPMGAVTPNA